MNRLRVDSVFAPAHGYDVLIQAGILDESAARITTAAPATAYAIITPENLADGPAGRVATMLRDSGLTVHLLTFPDGEAHKTRETWQMLTDRMLELEMGRDSCVIAVGGGVAGDVAGFVAATYMRGVPFVQIPTTLLAMIDASVGGKTGVDTRAGKNLVGAYHSPRLVIIDPTLLATLPDTHLRGGLAEAVKHGAIMDAEYFGWIGANASLIVECDADVLEHLITRSVAIKADIVSDDPVESHRRAVLNFGHTVAHAIEQVLNYDIPHGHAVSIGMCVETLLGEAVGITRSGTAGIMTEMLERIGLPTRTDADPALLLRAMSVDKKARHAQVRFVLLSRIGTAAPAADDSWTHAIAPEIVRTTLESAGRNV